jgi:hypothetical protein
MDAGRRSWAWYGDIFGNKYFWTMLLWQVNLAFSNVTAFFFEISKNIQKNTKHPQHNKNYIEVLGPPRDHYIRLPERAADVPLSLLPYQSQPDVVDDSR